MANSLSAKKRVRQSIAANARNRWRKVKVKSVIKAFDDALHAGDKAKAAEAYKAAARTLDQVSASGTIHKNNAARHKSRLAARLNGMSAKKA
jgi:small subunit ribosomal protein S20